MAPSNRNDQMGKAEYCSGDPVWESDLCIQCGKCVFVCPHAVIRHKVFDKNILQRLQQPLNIWTPSSRNSRMAYSVQVAPEDCTGCALCIEACPAKDKTNPARKSINLARNHPCANLKRQLGFFLGLPRLTAPPSAWHHQELSAARTFV